MKWLIITFMSIVMAYLIFDIYAEKLGYSIGKKLGDIELEQALAPQTLGHIDAGYKFMQGIKRGAWESFKQVNFGG